MKLLLINTMNTIIYKFSLLCLIAFLISCQAQNSSNEGNAARNDSQESTSQTKSKKPVILFFGNSLTAAYGLDPSEGFVARTQKKVDSLGLDYKVVNSGLSGETTAGGESRVDWILDQYEIEVFVLELGGNDGLRGINPEESYKNLQSIIDKVKNKNPNTKIVLAGMLAPPNMGPAFTKKFKENYIQLADKNDLALIPFLLEGVAGIRELNLPDGIHPTASGHKIITETIWKTLSPIIQ